jgi:hypothetical protein
LKVRLLKLFVYRALFHLGWKPAGKRLVDALGVRDEDAQVVAWMFLVKEGSRSVPILRDALQDRKHLEKTLTILADIGDRSVIPCIRPLTTSNEPKVAKSARAALQRLEAG